MMIYQDRLGTDRRRESTQKKTVLLQRQSSCPLRGLGRWEIGLSPTFISTDRINDHFTKTGSGQTQGKFNNKRMVSRSFRRQRSY